VDLFEYAIPDNVFGISKAEKIRCEVETSMRTMAGSIRTEYRSTKGSTARSKKKT
jgi:hypothetical protein